MRKFLLTLLVTVLSFSTALANNFMEFGVDDYNAQKSKWKFDVGFNYLDYPTRLPVFDGQFYKNKELENYEIYGLNLGFGRDLYLGAGFSITGRLGSFYYATFDNQTGKASKEIDLELASNRREHNLYGADAQISLNYIIEGSVVDFQPFVFGGVGVGTANIQREYKFLGIGTDAASQEQDRELYDVKLEDSFSYREAGLGINFISKRGITGHLKASKRTLALNERKVKGQIKEEGQTTRNISINENTSSEFDVWSASVGMGFLF